MKKLLCLLLALCMCFGLFAACGEVSDIEYDDDRDQVGEEDDRDPTGEGEEVTEPSHEEVKFELAQTEVTLSSMGETATIYSGQIPAGEVYWYSEDSSIVGVNAGVVTALGNGTATVHGVYGDTDLTCKVTSNAYMGDSRSPVMAAPTHQNVDASFFDDAVFVGDSISLKLSYDTTGKLGNAQFLVQGSYGVGNAIYDVLPTTYRGVEYQDLEKAIAATGAKKLFIMMGMNDIGLYGVDGTIENWGTLLGLIRNESPDIEIYIQSMTPIWSGGEIGGLNNANVNAYNVKLRHFAEENGCYFVDIAPFMRDATGGLATEFCSDNYVHLTDNGVSVWVSVLKAYANYPEE